MLVKGISMSDDEKVVKCPMELAVELISKKMDYSNIKRHVF